MARSPPIPLHLVCCISLDKATLPPASSQLEEAVDPPLGRGREAETNHVLEDTIGR